MKNIQLFTCIIGLALFGSIWSINVNAIPIEYRMKFDGAGIGPIGSGTFFWDHDAGIISDLSWNFGDGLIGGIRNEWLEMYGEKTLERFFLPTTGPFGWTHFSSDILYGSFPPGTGEQILTFCVGYSNPRCGSLMSTQYATYGFKEYTSEGTIFLATGYLKVFQVPEPNTLALIGLALASIGFSRKRRSI